MTKTNPLIAIIVLNWNGKKLLSDCLSTLLKSDYLHKQILVVDNNSIDGSQEFVKKSFPTVHLIENKENAGWSGGNNIGIQFALKKGADAILILNPDTRIKKDAITHLVETLFSNPKIGLVGAKMYHFDGQTLFDAGDFLDKKTYKNICLGNGEKDHGQYDTVFETDFVCGAALTIKRDVFEKIGLFDEKTFLYYDDCDFGLRAKKAGYLCCYSQKAIVYHKGSALTKVDSPLHTYYNARNRLLFLEKHAPFSVLLREYFALVPKICLFLVRPNKPWKKYFLLGVRDYFLRRFGERSYW